ncbi:MAG: hypothetical protein AAGN82_23985 [Myxococcota bacterium]
MLRLGLLVSFSLAGSALGCAPGATAARVVRPDAPTAATVMADTVACRDPSGYAEPLIVDWSSGSRLDLEATMRDGVAVVAYDCDTLTVLNGCRLRAQYAFVGVTVKEESIQLNNADEVQANLPLSGVTLSAGMDASSSLDLALVMVGKRSTTLLEANPAMLEGSCDGATHFVRAATVGAFAMARGSKGEVRAAADLFGAGVGAQSREEQSMRTVDGDRKACRKGSPQAETPPEGCSGALRLELVPLDDEASSSSPPPPSAGASAAERVTAAETCPEGMVRIAGKCTQATPEEDKCDQGNRKACEGLCKRGSSRGCFLLGRGYVWDTRSRDTPAARMDRLRKGAEYLKRACTLGEEEACYQQAWSHYNAVAYPELHDVDRALHIARASCDRGGARSCGLLARAHDPRDAGLQEKGLEPDAERYHAHAQRACDLGRAAWCIDLGKRLIETPDTLERGFALMRRACEGGDGMACRSWYEEAERHERVEEAIEGYALSCRAGRGYACGKAVAALSRGEHRDPARGAALGRRGCFELKDPSTCQALSAWPDYRELRPGERGRAAAYGCAHDWQGMYKELCADGAYHAQQRRRDLDLEACDRGDPVACDRIGRRQYRVSCQHGNRNSCRRLRGLDYEAYRRVVTDQCRQKPKSPWCGMMRDEGWTVPVPRRR